MRMKRSRIQMYHLKNREIVKDNEGNTSDEYGIAISFVGEIWPAGGKVQAEIYGQRLAYIRNCKVRGNYHINVDPKGRVSYDFGDFSIRELDGICVDAGPDSGPDYRIISILPHRPLYMELEKI